MANRDTPCQVDGCGAMILARGLCSKHYQRLRKYGDTSARPTAPMPGGRMAHAVCAVEDCQKDSKLTAGLCYAHYRQARRRGDFGPCAHPGCELGNDRAGYCPAHYQRLLLGRPMDAPMRKHHKDQLALSIEAENGPAVLRKMAARCVIDENGCWLYSRANVRGYGELRAGGHTWLAHRLVARFAIPSFSPECQVHHKCAVRLCCNPAHLQVVTPEENAAEMHERTYYKRRIADLERALSALSPDHELLRSQA